MNRDKKSTANERRKTGPCRRDSDRRRSDVSLPERRLGLDRRQKIKGPPERRLRHERRDCELGPPAGWRDRRRSAERRNPDVIEASFEEWARLKASKASVAAGKIVVVVEENDALAHIIIRD